MKNIDLAYDIVDRALAELCPLQSREYNVLVTDFPGVGTWACRLLAWESATARVTEQIAADLGNAVVTIDVGRGWHVVARIRAICEQDPETSLQRLARDLGNSGILEHHVRIRETAAYVASMRERIADMRRRNGTL